MRQRRFEHVHVSRPGAVRPLADDHPAILRKTTMFERSIVSAASSPRLFIPGDNNRKIGRVVTKGTWKGKPIYTLTLTERAPIRAPELLGLAAFAATAGENFDSDAVTQIVMAKSFEELQAEASEIARVTGYRKRGAWAAVYARALATTLDEKAA